MTAAGVGVGASAVGAEAGRVVCASGGADSGACVAGNTESEAGAPGPATVQDPNKHANINETAMGKIFENTKTPEFYYIILWPGSVLRRRAFELLPSGEGSIPPPISNGGTYGGDTTGKGVAFTQTELPKLLVARTLT